VILLFAVTLAAQAGDVLLLKADEVRPVSGPPIADGAVLVRDGVIEAVGPAAEIEVPEGAAIFEGAVLTPGLIDAWTTAGLTGPYNNTGDQDHAERDDPVRPELRALDGYNPDDALVGWIRGFGVTTVHAGPSPGQPVSGRTLLARTTAAPVDEVALVEDAFVVFSLGEGPKQRFGADGAASRMGSAATIRQALAEAAEYRERRRLPAGDRPPVDLGMEALVELLDGQRRAIFHAHRADDLLTALRIAEEYELDIALAGGAEAWLVRDRIAAAGAPVLVGPVMSRSWRDGEQRNSSFENAGLLADAGVPVAFMSGYEGYVPKVRVVLWEAAVAGANGLGPERTLEALTLGAAQILGIDGETGSLEVGKAADLALFDGDPFEYASHACVVVAAGEVVSDECR
jgi:imidazolonepropionase-like amidohydrolase